VLHIIIEIMATEDITFDYNVGFENDDDDTFSASSSSSQFTTAACSSFFASDTDTPTTCIYVLFTILLVEFFIDIYVYVIQYKDRGRLNQIEDQLSILKEKEMKLHGIDNFTKRAKIQRTINALEKDQKPLKALLDDSFVSAFTSSSNSSVAAFLFKKGWKYLSQPFLISLIALFYWGTPLVYFPSSWFHPMTRFISFSIDEGSIAMSAVTWAIICYRALKRLIHGMFI